MCGVLTRLLGCSRHGDLEKNRTFAGNGIAVVKPERNQLADWSYIEVLGAHVNVIRLRGCNGHLSNYNAYCL
jgi:hypothetical protein